MTVTDASPSAAASSFEPVAATVGMTCGNCGLNVGATVIVDGAQSYGATSAGVQWMRCPACGGGSVLTKDGAVWPPAPVVSHIPNLPDDVARAWKEAQSAHAVGAFTASEMMCRKILMHLAVDVAGSKAGGTFKGFIDDLDKAGYISAGLKPAVEKVKDRGNTANHDLPASTGADSLVTLRITEHLLRGVYEIPGL